MRPLMKPRLSALYPEALVTGASSGLGRAFAEGLMAEGVRVWGTARDTARLAALTAAGPSRFRPLALDLADGAGAEVVLRSAAREAGGAFDLVVQNAGYGAFGGFARSEFSLWQRQLEAMLVTTARLSHLALRLMRERSPEAPAGGLVHVSSIAAEFPLPFMSGYNMAKAGLSALSESLIFETRGTKVRVIDFRPGDYRTAFNQAMQSSPPPASLAAAGRAWPVLEAHLNAAPPAAAAAADLIRALRRRRRGVVRSGSFFQARLAPLLAGLAPAALVRAATARYFGSP